MPWQKLVPDRAAQARKRRRQLLAVALARDPAGIEANARKTMAEHAHESPASQPYLFSSQYLAAAIARQGRHAEAAEQWSRILDALLPAVGDAHAAVVDARIGRAHQLTLLARYDQAEADCRAAAQGALRLPPGAAADRFWFAAAACQVTVLNERDQHAEAERLAASAIQAAERSSVSSRVLIRLRSGLAASLNGQGRYPAVELMLRDLRPMYSIDVVDISNRLTEARRGLGWLPAAETSARRAIKEGQRNPLTWHYLVLTADTLLGSVLIDRGRPAEAYDVLWRNVATWTTHFGAEHPRTRTARAELARIAVKYER